MGFLNKLFGKKEDAVSNEVKFGATVDGQLETIEKVNDPVFSQKMMGDGYAIIPENGKIVAPVAGTITAIMKTKHALTMTTPDGKLEILLHMGLDTVELKGKPFEIKVAVGQEVKMGQELAQADIDMIKTAGKDPVIITAITNTNDAVEKATLTAESSVNAGQDVLTVVTK